MSIKPVDRQKMITNYIAAFKAANPESKTVLAITFKGGYFIFNDGAKFRKSMFRIMTETLKARAKPPQYKGFRRITK